MSFVIKNENAEFEFRTEFAFEQKNGGIEAVVSADAPIPEILPGDRLILPVDEGIAINVDEEYEDGEFPCNSIGGYFCSGHKGSIGMLLIERNKSFLAVYPEDLVNTEYRAERADGIYRLFLVCHKSSRVFYRIFDSLPKACKWYRDNKNPSCLTLADKIKKNHDIETLAGGAVFWIWNDNYNQVMYADKDVFESPASGKAVLDIAEDLYENGVQKALFGLFFEEDSRLSEPLYKKYGYLSTQYDNYNDVLNPDLLNKIPNNRVKNCDYTARRMKDYPQGVIVNKDGNLAPAWALKGFDGKMYPQNTMCPICAKQAMEDEIPQILRKYPYYKGRFIDVFGGGMCECFSKKHPLTREESIKVKNEAFEALEKIGLIPGTEDGFDRIIDHLAYTEGLHSPVYFRNKDSGRNHANLYSSEQAEHIKKHMINPRCRVPFWHLVYHDCMFAFPYWGDSTAMSPEIIKDKILFACLYGCPPLYSFTEGNYRKARAAILESYRKITEVHAKTALLPMTDFKVLSNDYMLQSSVFGDKYKVTVNFSDEMRASVPAKDFIFEEMTI